MGLYRRALLGLAVSLVAYVAVRQVLYDLLLVQLHPVSRQNTGGRRVLVTGSSRGIGEALAHVYAEAGAHVAVHARSRKSLDKVMQKCQQLGAASVHAVTGDMSEASAPERVVAEAAAALGGLDIVVVNHVLPPEFSPLAGVVAALRDGRLSRDLQTNFISYLLAAHAALPHLERSAGSLVLVSSAAAKLPVPYCYGYCFCKRAVEAVHAALRQELAINGSAVHLGIATVGLVGTESARRAMPHYYKSEMQFASPERTARDIAALPLSRARELVTPWYVRVPVLLRELAAGHIELHLQGLSRRL